MEQVQALADRGELRISLHGYEELAADAIRAEEVVAALRDAIAIADYPAYPKGPCVLVLEYDGAGKPIHVVWGIPAGRQFPAVLVTAYRPDPREWDETWRRRRR